MTVFDVQVIVTHRVIAESEKEAITKATQEYSDNDRVKFKSVDISYIPYDDKFDM